MNLIHNDDECEKCAQNLMKIFENDMYNKESKYHKFGVNKNNKNKQKLFENSNNIII